MKAGGEEAKHKCGNKLVPDDRQTRRINRRVSHPTSGLPAYEEDVGVGLRWVSIHLLSNMLRK